MLLTGLGLDNLCYVRALQLMGNSDSVSMTLCIWMENIGDQESLLSLATNLRLLLSFGMFLAPSPDPAFFLLLLLRWDMIWLTTSDTRFSFYCIWDTNVHLLRTSHTFWVMYARWMAASWFSWLFLCRVLLSKDRWRGSFCADISWMV